MTSKTVVERIAEAAWVALNFDNDPHDGQPHNTHAWNALTAAIRKAMRQDETSPPRHDVTCNYPRGPLYGPGCICMVVNKHIFATMVPIKVTEHQ